jgi:hypothetical protein
VVSKKGKKAVSVKAKRKLLEKRLQLPKPNSQKETSTKETYQRRKEASCITTKICFIP